MSGQYFFAFMAFVHFGVPLAAPTNIFERAFCLFSDTDSTGKQVDRRSFGPLYLLAIGNVRRGGLSGTYGNPRKAYPHFPRQIL